MQAALEYADRSLLMLADEEGRYSLWPADAAVPQGWTLVLSTTERRRALESIGVRLPDVPAVTFTKRGALVA